MTTTTYISTGKAPKLDELQHMVGGLIEVIELSDGRQMVVNEEGLILGLPFNPEASALNAVYGNGQEYLAGNAVVLGGTALLE